MNIGTLSVGIGQPCALIGEIGNAPNGKYENAVRLLDGLKAAGASAAKLQCYSVEELIALRGDGPAPAQWSHMTMRELYSRAATPFDWFAPLYRHAESIGLPIFSSVFGPDSLALLESIGNTCHKVAALDNTNAALHRAIRKTRKPVLVSTRREQVKERTELGKIYGADVAFLLCPEGYPQAPASFALGQWDFVGEWDDRNCEVCGPDFLGLSSHCLAPELPIAAVARGAKLLEYHVQLDDEPSELEANVSLTITQFRDMVQAVRRTEEMLG